MTRRRSPFGFLFLVGMGVLIGAAIFGGTEAIAGVLATPFVILGFMFKVFLFMLLFGFIMKMMGRGARRRGSRHHWSQNQAGRWPEGAPTQWRRCGPQESDEDQTHDDRFEEWHRMAHARQEVDEHTPPVEA